MTVSKTNNTKKCGLIMPISAIDGCTEQHWAEVQTIIKEALYDTDFIVELVSDSNESGIIQKRIVQNIYDNEIVVCDVSAKNPNVMFELGMRLAFDKPTIIIKDDKTNYSFDTGQIEHLEYPRDLHYHSIQSFKDKLKIKVIATYEASKQPNYTTFLKHFGPFVVANIEEREVGKEDYLMEMVSELRNEFIALRRSINIRESNIPSSQLPTPSTESLEFPELNFLLNCYLKNKYSLEDVTNPESEPFKKFIQEYLAGYPEGTAQSAAFQQHTKNNFLKASKRIKNMKTAALF